MPEPAKSLWASNAIAEPTTKKLETDLDVDTVIVGAGFTGLRAALLLAEAGQNVVVLEANTIAWGASGRNGGQVNPLPPENSPATIEKRHGSKYLDRIAETMLGSADELFGIIYKYQIECQARQNGWLRVDHHPGAMQSSRQTAKAWSDYGIEIQYLEGEDLHSETGSTVFQSGTLVPKGGAIHPLSYARGLAQAAINAGARIYTNSAAQTLIRKNNKWQISSNNQTLLTDNVLLCTNGYTDSLVPDLARSIIPLVSIQMATERLSISKIQLILPNGRTISDTRRTIVYGRREPDNRILLGSLGRLSAKGDQSAFDYLKTEAVRIYPVLKDVDWEFHWSGQIAITNDHLPHLHEPEPGIFAGLGYNGRGVAMSNVMGRILAERVLGMSADDSPFPTTKIKTYPFHQFYKLGAKTVMWWMRNRDQREINRA